MRRLVCMFLLCCLLPCGAWAKAETIELSLYHLQDAPLVRIAIEDSVRRFMDDHPGVTVHLTMLVNDVYKRRTAIAAATDSLPDIFVTWGGSALAEYVGIGRVYNLSEWMMADNYADRFFKGSLQHVSFSGGIWGVPVENIAASVVFYNTEIFSAYGLTPPDTYEEMLEIIDVLRANDIVPFALANRSGWTSSMYYMYLVDRLGGADALDEALRYYQEGMPGPEGGFADPIFLQAWQMMAELIDRGAFPADTNTLDEDTGDTRQMLYDGSAAMILMGSWLISNVKSENPEFLQKLDFFPFPSVTQSAAENRLIGTLGDNFYSIASSCDHPELAFELIQYLIDGSAITLRMQAGKIPPVSLSLIDTSQLDLLAQKLLSYVETAEHMQLWYDQMLPPKLAEMHKQLCRDIFTGLSPEGAAQKMADAAMEYFNEQAR